MTNRAIELAEECGLVRQIELQGTIKTDVIVTTNWKTTLQAFYEAAKHDGMIEMREQVAQIVEQWPLSVTNMTIAELYARHGWANAISGVLRADVCSEIRALEVK